MNPTLLRQVYQQHRIKKKKLRWYKEAPNQDSSVIRQQLATMKRQLTMAKRDNYRIIYLDEAMFTKSALPKSEYYLPKQNVNIDKSQTNEPAMALLSGISKERG